ncbi:MAG TPA: hypothetical protein VN083_03510, partial [Vicinamibacteria bacterium]|nr:hypothetical protein [Vicinamibacteria bacterium]
GASPPNTLPSGARTSGSSVPPASATPGVASPGSTSPTSTRTSPGRPLPVAARSTSSSPAGGVIAIAILASLLTLSCIVWGVARWYAFEPRWVLSLGHALDELGFRASATREELADWVRLGR